jgi:hypothetical protein
MNIIKHILNKLIFCIHLIISIHILYILIYYIKFQNIIIEKNELIMLYIEKIFYIKISFFFYFYE